MQEEKKSAWEQETLSGLFERWKRFGGEDLPEPETVHALAGKIRGYGLKHGRAIVALAALKAVTQCCREVDAELEAGVLIIPTQDNSRCEICDWPLAASASEGCVPGNCSYRPPEGTNEYRRIQQRREALKKRSSS